MQLCERNSEWFIIYIFLLYFRKDLVEPLNSQPDFFCCFISCIPLVKMLIWTQDLINFEWSTEEFRVQAKEIQILLWLYFYPIEVGMCDFLDCLIRNPL